MTQIIAPSKMRVIGRVSVNHDRAYRLLDQLMDKYEQRKALYQHIHRIDAPQTVHRPKALEVGSTEHARWLFFAAMTDRREVSSRVYEGHNRLWQGHADQLYNQPLNSTVTEEVIVEFIKRYKIGMPDTGAKSWVACSDTLFHKLDGRPTQMYEGRSIDDIVQLKKQEWHLPGFGSKILSLLAIFYAELDMIKIPPDAFPVDVHVQRFALSTGILQLRQKERNYTLESILRPLLSKICHERGWQAVEVAHAIWFLGNKLCTACSINSQAEVYCPVYQSCGGAFMTKDYSAKGLWNPKSRYPKGGNQVFGCVEQEGGFSFPQPDLFSR